MDSDSSVDGESGAKSWGKGHHKESGEDSSSSEDERVEKHSSAYEKHGPTSPPQSPPRSPSSPIQSPPQSPSSPNQSPPRSPSSPNRSPPRSPSSPNRSPPRSPSSPNRSPPRSPSSPNRSPPRSPSSPNRSPPRSPAPSATTPSRLRSPTPPSPIHWNSPRSPSSPIGSPPRSARYPPQSPPRSPPHSPPASPSRRELSRRSPSPAGRYSRSNSGEVRSRSNSSARRSRSPSRSRSRSGSPRVRSPSGSPGRSGRSDGRQQRSPSGSPRRSRSPSSVGSRSPRRRSFSNSRSAMSPTGSVSRSPASYPKRGSKSKAKRDAGRRSDSNQSDDGHLSDSNQSDDGRSNISSSSSFGMSNSGRASPGSQGGRSKKSNHCDGSVSPEKGKFEPHNAEDLSDVSDLDSTHGDGSLDSVSDDDGGGGGGGGDSKKRNGVEAAEPGAEVVEEAPRKEVVSIPDEMEQLDFEAEEPQPKEDREEGECEGARAAGSRLSSHEARSEDDGELNADEVEEGEITDEDENRPEETEPRPICRFYNRGQCTWGSSCRFLHPGVTDKGNYTMFDMVRPLVPSNGPPLYGPMMDYRAPIERPMAPVGPIYAPIRKEDPPLAESAWERGLRHAKEMLRKATKRKETDMDFEEKKMNLSLGQDELDKENDYYTRPASPALDDEPERWSSSKDLVPESKHHRVVVADRYDDMADPYYGSHHPRESEMWRRVHYEGDMRMSEYGRDRMAYDRRHPAGHGHPHGAAHRTHPHPGSQHDPGYYSDKYERKKKSHTVREVIVQRSHKSWKDEGVSSTSHHGRGDEWSDPWMRSKSPNRKPGARPPRRQSYSSGSSYSSSSSSRSSRSYSSSRSRSGSRSRSRSNSRSLSMSRSRSRSPVQALRRGAKTSPHHHKHQRATARPSQSNARFRGSKPLSPALLSEKRAATERVMHMNPPAPSPRKQRPQSPGMRKAAQNPPLPPNNRSVLRGTDRKAAKARPSRSRSSSGSDSSGSSSDSSESSLSSSSSSSRNGSPPVRQKKIAIDERLLAQSTKIKAMDALKLSGQKQQIKLTLKTPGAMNVPAGELESIRRERTMSGGALAGKKRPAESPPGADATKATGGIKPAAKKPTSRREELLKQLKAVEEAIARKRSKIA